MAFQALVHARVLVLVVDTDAERPFALVVADVAWLPVVGLDRVQEADLRANFDGDLIPPTFLPALALMTSALAAVSFSHALLI